MSLVDSVRQGLHRVVSWVDLDIRRRGGRWHRGRDLPRVPTVVDVGVGVGGTPSLYNLFPDSRFILIDPLEECRRGVSRLLSRDGNVFVASALGATEGVGVMNVAANPGRSSLLQPLDQDSVKETREVPVRRLDDVLSELDITYPVGLKVDAEGYELQVLDGAPRTLERTAFVIMEVNVRPRFEDTYSFEDAIDHMSRAGFRVHAVLHAGSGKCDVAWVRTSPSSSG